MRTLYGLGRKRVIRAENGGHGRGGNRTGRAGRDVVLQVPVGTVVWKATDGRREFVADVAEGQRVVVAKGGAGGRGNARFVSPINQEPLLAEVGGEGEAADLHLELKLVADVGIIGEPNVGKSTLLAACSRARPKVAEYPFTTVEPVLGSVEVGGRAFVAIEVPGLLEGAHRGVGLGHRFLRHAERTRVFIHVLDGFAVDPLQSFRQTMGEIQQYDPDMAQRPQVVAVNKVDITEVRQRAKELRTTLAVTGLPLFFISAATGEGVRELMEKALELLDSLPVQELARRESAPAARLAPRERVAVEREEGVFVVHFSPAERLAARVNLEDHRVRMQLVNELRRMGVVRALEAAGIKRGDTVRLGDVELEW